MEEAAPEYDGTKNLKDYLMLPLIKELLLLLTKEQRRKFLYLQLLVIIMALAELGGIASIAPFMSLVGNIDLIETNEYLAQLYAYSELSEPRYFVIAVGFAVMGIMFATALISVQTMYQLSMFGAMVGAELANRLYVYYMQQSWLFHAMGSSAQLTKQVSTEALRVTVGIIQPLMKMNARLVLASLISLAVIIYNPIVAFVGLFIIGSSYYGFYLIIRKRLRLYGKIMSDSSGDRFRFMNEGFGGIKELSLLNRKEDLLQQFIEASKDYGRSSGKNAAYAIVPRYMVELLAFGSMVLLVLYLLIMHQGNLGYVLPILSVYAMAGYKLLPSFQISYQSLATIKGNLAAFEAIREDLEASRNIDIENYLQKPSFKKLDFNESIELCNISFSYPTKENLVLNKLDLKIKKNEIVGIVGPSGSGKSTAIDVILGLIDPKEGELKIDGKPTVSKDLLRQWQNNIGFVPQTIFLTEGTIAENVAFGLPAEEINEAQVHKALELAHLDDFVADLPQGIHTTVGERGIQLSGGQRQRIGIARALYNDAEVLVFDEATSALDGITEKAIMDAIHDFSGNKTIIMIAHRLKTVEKCDQIYFLENGQVTDVDTYSNLIQTNAFFKRMAEHA